MNELNKNIWREMHKAIAIAFHMFHAYMIVNGQCNDNAQFNIDSWLEDPINVVRGLVNLGYSDEKIGSFFSTIKGIHVTLQNTNKLDFDYKIISVWLGTPGNEFRF